MLRFLTGLVLLTVAGLLAGCGQLPGGGMLTEPLPNTVALSTVAPLPTVAALPEATPLPTVALLPAATVLPTAIPLPTTAPLPTPTLLPTAAALPAATAALPATATVAPIPESTPAATPTPAPDLALPLVTIGQFAWPVELAVTAEQQAQGLSGRAELAAGSGMLFVWDQESRRTFWMPDMNFPLDLVWISGDCAVVDITRDAPPQAPGQSRAELPRYTVEGVQYVLEINAGESALHSVNPGDRVEFGGSIAGEHGC